MTQALVMNEPRLRGKSGHWPPNRGNHQWHRRLYGLGNVFEQTAAINDGSLGHYKLEMRNFRKHLWKLAWIVRAFRAGTHCMWKDVRTPRCVELYIGTRHPMPINTDGEIVTATRAHFKVLPGTFTVVNPAAVSGQSVTVGLFHRCSGLEGSLIDEGLCEFWLHFAQFQSAARSALEPELRIAAFGEGGRSA